MSLQRFKHLGTCALSAGLLTFGAMALDGHRSGVQRTQAGLNWARQVASQAEGLVFRAKEAGERNPIDWAVNYLSQGEEPRLVHISRAHLTDSSAQNGEIYSLDHTQGLFDYTRVFAPEDGSGVRVQLWLGYEGFLGSRSVATGDLLMALLFALTFGIVFLRTGRHFGFDDSRYLRLLVSQWVVTAKSQLIRHGAHVREMVRQAQRLAFSSGRSRELVGELRTKIHDGLTELHGSREFYQEGETIAARAETLALNMAIEANRLGGDARRIADMASELHRRIQALHAVNRKGQALVQSLERRIEPWSTDADLAFHAFDEIKNATELLGRHIRGTTESLLSQAKLIQGLNQELGAPADPAAPVVARVSAVAPAEAAKSVASVAAREIHKLPDPLPPIAEKSPKPLFRRIRAKKSA